MSQSELFVARLLDPAWVKGAVERGRKLTGGANACAATLSQLLLDFGLLDKAHTWTSQIVGTYDMVSLLEQNFAVKRIHHPADVRPGDIIASRDRAGDGNDAPDHVFVAVSEPQGVDNDNPFVMVVDNYCRDGKPYWRNLGKGGSHAGKSCKYTPMAYALRFVAPEAVGTTALTARQLLVNKLTEVYALAQRAQLPRDTIHALNAFRWSAELGRFMPQKPA